ncbi:MAG: HipA N-terminal domain-containing protein, partial [Firmicutes bacterium]|nr:HipA N-terminal domain-containing protein [Bacillota bacterium]
IPEGWLLNVVTHNWKIDRRDRFGLLLIACKDTIGIVTIQEERL